MTETASVTTNVSQVAGGQGLVSASKLLVNNRWIESEAGKTFATTNPATGEKICQVSEADVADVDKAVRAARAAFEGSWSKTQAAERARLLRRLADLIESHADELPMLESMDNGMPITIAKAVNVPAAWPAIDITPVEQIRFTERRFPLMKITFVTHVVNQ